MTTEKRKPGRPAGRNKMSVAVTLDIGLVSKLKAMKSQSLKSLSKIIEELLELALVKTSKP